MSAYAVMRPIYGASAGWSIPHADASPVATPVRGFPDPDHADRRMLVCVGASYDCPQREDVRVGEITAL